MSALLYIIYLTIIHPLLIVGGYFGVARTKVISLVAASIIFVVAQSIEFITGRNKPTKISKSPSAILLCVLAVLILLSTLVSEYKPDVFLGYYGWWNGALTLIACIAAVLVMSLIPEYAAVDPSKICVYTYIGVLLPSLLAVADVMGADIFGWRTALEWSDRSVYTSTIGNYAWLSSMLMCALPLALKGYRSLRERSKGGIAGLCNAGLLVIFTCYNAVATDISIVTLIVCVFLLVLVYINDTSDRRVRMIVEPIAMYAVSSVILWTIFAYMQNAIIRDGIIEYAAAGGRLTFISLIILLSASIFAVLSDKKRKSSMEKEKATESSSGRRKRADHGRTVISGINIPVVSSIVISGLIAFISMAGVILSPFVDDDFGGSRGYIWHTAISAIKSRGIKDIMIGSGPDTFYTVTGGVTSSDYAGQTLTVSHNVFLNASINIGIPAAVLLVVIIFLSVYNCINRIRTDGAYLFFIAAFVGMAAFLGFGYINSVIVGLMVIIFGNVRSQSDN